MNRRPYTVDAYFLEGVKLYKQFQLKRWLTSAGILPSNEKSYSREQLHQALGLSKSLTGVFKLECDRPSKGAGPRNSGSPGILSEIRICLDAKLKPINCAFLFGDERMINSGFSSSSTSGLFDDYQCGNEVILLEF